MGLDLPEGHLPCGQGPGFVRADHRGRAQRLHGGKPPDDGILSSHGLGSKGQSQGDYERQGFGHSRHSQGYGSDERVH